MRNEHFGTRVFWYCGECWSTRHTANRSLEKARPRQELANGCSKFKKTKRSAKRSDTSNCTRSPRPIHVEHNSQPVVQKLDTQLKSSKRSRPHVFMNKLSCRSDKQEFVRPSISRTESINIYPSISMNVFEDSSKRIKRPTVVVRPGSSLKSITENDSDGVQKTKDSGIVCCSGFKIRDANFQEKDLPVALVINGYEEQAQRAFWKGDFDVFHVVSHVYNGIQSHFSSKVSSKFYDTSKHLPKTLYFKALARKDVWPEAFLLEPPNKKDIGLYFFPCAAERHKEKFVRLLERLNLGDHALQTSVDGIELIVFLSNQLPTEHQRIDGETYLWGVFHHLTHEKSRSPELVQFSPSYRTDAVMESNNSDISVPGVADLPCIPSPSPVSKDLNYVNPSSVKIPSVNVAKPIDLDGPPGVSSLITPRVSRCSSSQHPSSSHKTTCEGSIPSRMESRGHIVETTSEPHQVQPELNLQKDDASLDTSSGFLEPNSGASNNEKSYVVNVPLKKLTNLIDPDTPPGFSNLRVTVPYGLPSPQHSSRSHKINPRDPRLSRLDRSGQIAATTVGGFKPASTPHQVQPNCHLQKADANIHTYVQEPNSKDTNYVKSSFIEAIISKITNPTSQCSHYDFSKFGPPGFPERASYQHPNSSSSAIPMEPMSPIKKYDGYEHSTVLGGYPHQDEVQPIFHQVGGPVYEDIRPGFSQFGPPPFPPLPGYSTRPGSLPEFPSEAAWSSRLDRRGHLTSTIAGGYAAPASQMHEMQPSYPQVPAGPQHPVFRPEFSQFPSYSARPSSSVEIPFEAPWSSRTAGRGHVPSNTVRGYARATSQQNKMQRNYPQGPPTG